MRAVGLLAFGVTVGLLAPVAAMELTAGPREEAMLFPRGVTKLKLGEAVVNVSLDKGLVERNGLVRLHVDSTRTVSLGIVVLGSTGTEGGRVADPPIAVFHDTVTVKAGAEASYPIKLEGARAESGDSFQHYTVFVTGAKAGAKLARLQRHADGPDADEHGVPMPGQGAPELNEMIHTLESQQTPDDDDDAPLGTVARFDVFARPHSAEISLAMADVNPRGKPFPVEVTVTNPTGHAFDAGITMSVPGLGQHHTGLAAPEVTFEPTDLRVTLAAHETRKITVNVTGINVGVLGLEATLGCYGDDCPVRRDAPSTYEVSELVDPQ